MVESIKELGLSGNQFYIREINGYDDCINPISGWVDMAQRTGVDFRKLNGINPISNSGDENLQWVDVPNGVWYKRAPYLWPINAPDTFFLNIAKFKTHGMGVTLCCKNLQGTMASGYQTHCSSFNSSMSINQNDRYSDAFTTIQANYNRHVADGIPRWDKPGNSGGIWMETWASRCLDNNSVSKANLHIVEGIYGRDGNGFVLGPSPQGLGTDYLTNVIIFGLNQFYVDIIGHWLAGHEPGNFGLFHIAKERGLSEVLNPANIPVYEWDPNGSPVRKPFSEFERTELKTYYLQRNYSGQTEAYYHLCNEQFEYPEEQSLITSVQDNAAPRAFVLHQNKPNPFNPVTSIEYYLPSGGHARLEVYNATGQLVDVLVDGYHAAGSHMATWNTAGKSSGVYFYRFRSGGFTETKKMTLLK